jgi:hypothetical protein
MICGVFCSRYSAVWPFLLRVLRLLRRRPDASTQLFFRVFATTRPYRLPFSGAGDGRPTTDDDDGDDNDGDDDGNPKGQTT